MSHWGLKRPNKSSKLKESAKLKAFQLLFKTYKGQSQNWLLILPSIFFASLRINFDFRQNISIFICLNVIIDWRDKNTCGSNIYIYTFIHTYIHGYTHTHTHTYAHVLKTYINLNPLSCFKHNKKIRPKFHVLWETNGMWHLIIIICKCT